MFSCLSCCEKPSDHAQAFVGLILASPVILTTAILRLSKLHRHLFVLCFFVWAPPLAQNHASPSVSVSNCCDPPPGYPSTISRSIQFALIPLITSQSRLFSGCPNLKSRTRTSEAISMNMTSVTERKVGGHCLTILKVLSMY